MAPITISTVAATNRIRFGLTHADLESTIAFAEQRQTFDLAGTHHAELFVRAHERATSNSRVFVFVQYVEDQVIVEWAFRVPAHLSFDLAKRAPVDQLAVLMARYGLPFRIGGRSYTLANGIAVDAGSMENDALIDVLAPVQDGFITCQLLRIAQLGDMTLAALVLVFFLNTDLLIKELVECEADALPCKFIGGPMDGETTRATPRLRLWCLAKRPAGILILASEFETDIDSGAIPGVLGFYTFSDSQNAPALRWHPVRRA